MKRFLTLAASTCLLAPLSSQAVEISPDLNLAITLGAVSDYRSLGLSQTQGDPAIQLDTVLSHSSGAFLGIWSSNVDFGTKTNRENGYYAGYYHAFSDDINVSASLGRYEYPKEAAFDTNEVYAVSNIYGFRLGYIYDFDVKQTPNMQAFFVGYNFKLPLDSILYVKYGQTDYNFDIVSSNGSSRQKYNDWEATLSKNYLGIDWSVSYVDTDLSKSECMWIAGVDDICSSAVVFGAKKTF